jgi:anti-anti-sigma factor
MNVTTSTVGMIDVVHLDGKLDVTGSRMAGEALAGAIVPGGRLIVDMTDCDYVASSGLRVLLITAKQAQTAGCQAVLCGVQASVADVIEMTGFGDVLPIYPSRDAALAALDAEPVAV